MKEMKPKIGFIGSDRQSILEDLNFAIKNKFDYYEIQQGKREERLDLKPEIIEKVRKTSKNNNISLNLHSGPRILDDPFESIKREIILANRIGIKAITIHSGHKNKKISISKNFEFLTRNLKEIVKFGNKYRIRIGLENSYGELSLSRKAKDLLNAINSVKGLGLVFDTGHANIVSADPIDYFKKVKDFVINIHLHDNDGKSDQHALIGAGNIDFKCLLKECKNSNYYGPFILEVFPYENILKSREIFFNLWNQI